MRSFAYVLLAVAAAAGCGETAASTPPTDAGSDASIDLDGGIDGSVDDAGTDGGVPPDGGQDGGPDAGPDGGGSWCTTSALCPACPDPDALCDPDSSDACPIGEVCLSTGCDDFARCFVTGGGGCQDNDDCGNPAYECNLVIGRCLRTDPGCDDSNDCVAGFACESGVCTDRRVPCETGSDCPHGFTCFFASPDQRFCRRISRPCSDDIDCLTLGVPCGDADGDGSKECMPSLMPNVADPVSCDNTQCAEDTAPVCESTVQGTAAVCGQFGLCVSSIDCAAGFECRDLWGDRRAECALPDGSCVDSSVCDDRTVCGSPRAGGPPACVSGAAM
jgi:hypothetical protein